MANPTLKTSAPGYASIVAALWVSDIVDQAGVPSKGAWDAKNSVFYPAWGGASMSGVALGSTTRRGLASSVANCGIDLGLAANHTGTIFDLAGPELAIVALYRRPSTATSMVIQNQESFGAGGYCGWSLSPAGTAAVTGRVRAGVTPPGSELAAAFTTANPVNELVCLVYDRSSTVTGRIWKNGTLVAGGSAAPNLDPITYGTPTQYLRRAALFNYPESRAINAGALELFAVIVYNEADWVTGGTALTPLGTTEAALLAGSFHNAYFDFGDSPPVLTSPTGTKTGSTTASGSVTTDKANGTLYRLASVNATESAATVKAAALTSAVSAIGAQAVTFTGLTPNTAYYPHYVHTDSGGNDSVRVTGASFTTDPVADTTLPTLVGSITVSSLTATSYTLSWPAGSDNVAVSGYDYSLNGGTTWTSNGTALAVSISGRTAATTDQVRVRARDAAGGLSTPVLSAAVTLLSSGDSTPPVLAGSITISNLTATSFTAACSAATDNSGTVSYDWSRDGGATWVTEWPSQIYNFTALSPSTSYQVRVRARDPSGLLSTPVLSATVITLAGVVAPVAPVGVRPIILAVDRDGRVSLLP